MFEDMLGRIMRLLVTVPVEALGTLADLVEKLASEESQKWLSALKKFLRKENPWDVRNFDIWKTIKLGMPGLKTADDFRKAIKALGMKIGDWADNILGKPAFMVAAREMEVDLVKVTVGELGFKEVARYDKICERAKELGLQLCPNEVGPQLRLQYKNQPKGEWIWVAMEAILRSDGDLNVFFVEHDDSGLWLDGGYGHPGDLFSPGAVFVFVRPRK